MNRLLNTTAFYSPPHRLSDRSLILRILHEIRTRPALTILYHVRAHTRDHCPLPSNFAALRGVALHQDFNRLADRAAKSSLTASRFIIPDELTFRPPALFRLARPLYSTSAAPVHILRLPVGNLPLDIHLDISPSKFLRSVLAHPAHRYTFSSTWHTRLYSPLLWLGPSSWVLTSRSHHSLRKFLIQILGCTLPTFHRLHKIRPRLYPDVHCALCHNPESEIIEHIFFKCTYFNSLRSTMLASIFDTLSSKLSLLSAFVRSQWINPSCLEHPSLAVPTL
jgi:hypothetical protein